jgi:hypothetical protein
MEVKKEAKKIKLKIDKEVIQSIFCEEPGYNPIIGKSFLDITTGEIISITESFAPLLEDYQKEDDDLESLVGWEKKEIQEIQNIRQNPDMYLELVPLSDVQWDEVFQEFAKKYGIPYLGSIGGSLRQDENYKYWWWDYKYEKALDLGQKFLHEHGIEFLK